MRNKPGCELFAYVDDTLIVVTGNYVDIARSGMNAQLVQVLRRLDVLSLVVAPDKAEAILFPTRRKLVGLPVLFRLNQEYIRTANTMKYLGIILDSKLNFLNHFKYAVDKTAKISRALGSLMPNLRGPDERRQRLYANVIGSVALYDMPVWSETLLASREGKRLYRG